MNTVTVNSGCKVGSLRSRVSQASRAAIWSPTLAGGVDCNTVAVPDSGWVISGLQSAGNNSGQSAVIKISEAPMWQATRNVIPVGKVVALDTAASNNRVIASASFEIVDGFASGTTTIEVGGSQAVPASVDNDSGKVTLNGARSVGDYDKAIRDIKLRMGTDVPPNAVFRIKITLTDQSGKTESKTVTLQVNQPEVVSRNP